MLAAVALAPSCAPPKIESGVVRVATLVHLADRLDAAMVDGAEAPASARTEMAWSFAEPRPEWRKLSTTELPRLGTIELTPVADGLRIALSRPSRQQGLMFIGGLRIDLRELKLGDWERVLVRARSHERFGGITVTYNVDDPDAIPGDLAFVLGHVDVPPIFNDGSVQTYSIPILARAGATPETPFSSLAVLLGSPDAAKLDLLEVELVPRGASYLDRAGSRPVTRAGETRQSLFAHAPVKLGWPVVLPAGARLDFGLSVTAGDPVTYRVRAAAPGKPSRILFEERVDDATTWRQRSIDLSGIEGDGARLELEAASDRPGAVALWGAPIVSGRSSSSRPNIIFYVIDGGGADLMSVYGYNRRTTPFLERLAEEGAVFEHAFSNATWTQPSTASFMTSLQHSVLGGLRRGVHSTPVPANATTMAERMRAGGYETAAFMTNPNSGRVIGLERGVDRMRDIDDGPHSTSSAELQERFWEFRDEYPAHPFWVHFQTTDVHEPNEPAAPFDGLYVSRAERQQLEDRDKKLFEVNFQEFGQTSIVDWYQHALDKAGIDRRAYYTLRRGLYDESMAHQDYQLGRFVERLKATGEWQNTIFIVAADHGHPAGTFARFGRGEFEPQPDRWEGALFDSYATHVPLIVVWPGRIQGGQRFTAPVSMIDVLPTLLDLAGLPRAEVAMGESLAPLLRGRAQKPKPVILDEFRVDESTGEMIGNLEIVDGRWGASLEIGPVPAGADSSKGRHAVPAGGRWAAHHPFFPDVPRLLLYDLWRDPFALQAVNEHHPDLVEKYRHVLSQQWQAERALATRYEGTHATELDPEQLRQLKALGYIQ
jgi:arylsulfatase A-like enzyme